MAVDFCLANRVSPPGRILEFDSLRGVGAIAILAFHLWPKTVFWGWSRVDLFFVLSGYLITSITLKYIDNAKFFRTFYLRRMLRTWPSYFLLLGIVYGWECFRGIPPTLREFFHHLTFTQNLSLYHSKPTLFPNPLLIHTWCLAIEEQFYLIWPILVWVAGRRYLLALAIWMAVNSVFARALGLHPWTLLARSDGLGLGAILAILHDDPCGVMLRRKRLFTAVFAAIATASLVWMAQGSGGTFSRPLTTGGALTVLAANLLYTSIIGIIICYPGSRFFWPLRWRWLRYLGTISYGIFMYNFIIININYSLFNTYNNYASYIIFIECTVVGAISWECFERPIANFKIFLPYGKKPPAIS